jgi:hypothetical protein
LENNLQFFFLDLNSSFFQARLWESATAEHWSLLVAWLYRRKSLNFGTWLPESGGNGWILAMVARIWYPPPEFIQYNWILAVLSGFRLVWQESKNFCRILAKLGQISATVTGRRWIPFYIVSDFFVRVKCPKIF